MPGYILLHAEVTNADEYEQFKIPAAKAIEDHGGKYLVRGGANTALEGDSRLSGRVVGIRDLRAIRLRSATAHVLAMDGIPAT
jgi:uncharacterized protein (DUF1330 family)